MEPTAPPDRNRRRRSTRASSSARCRIARVSTGCSTRPAKPSTSARRAISRSACRAISRRARTKPGSRSCSRRLRGWKRRSRAPKARRSCSRTTSSRPRSRATTSSSATTRATRTSASRASHFRSCASIAASSIGRTGTSGPFPSAGAVREGMALLQKVSSSARARTPCSPTARAPACCIRSSAAARLASASSPKPTMPRTCRAPCSSCRGRRPKCSRSSRRRWTPPAPGSRSSAPRAFATRSPRLTQLQSRQFVESATAGDIDVVAAATEQGLVAVNVVMVRGGRHVGDRTWFPRHADALSLAEVVPAFSRAALCRATGAADDHRRGRGGGQSACRSAVRAGGTARADRRQSWGRAPRVARDGRRRMPSSRSGRSSRRRRPRRTGSISCRRRSGCRPKRSGSNASTFRTRWASARWPPA